MNVRFRRAATRVRHFSYGTSRISVLSLTVLIAIGIAASDVSLAASTSAEPSSPTTVANNDQPQAAAKKSFFGGFFATGRRTVPFPKKFARGQIVVSFSDRRLYRVEKPGTAVSYPISAPRSQSNWSGTERVSRKAINPSWRPTPSMRRENPNLPTVVPGGHPRNPLGVRALYLGATLYRIHGTDAPWTIGKAVSKGCIRMHNEHVIEVYNRTKIGTRVTVTWNSFKPRAKH